MGSRRQVLALALVMLFFFPPVLSIVPASANGESWLPGWTYRKSHIVFSAPGAGTNYQVKIIVHYGSGTDIGENVYCNAYCKTDFGDIRFTDNDGITLLDHWMEEKTDSVSATFWVKIADDLSLISANIYIYYGNSVAATTSDGDATFLEFTHFEDVGLPADWEVKDNDMGSHSVSNSKLIVESDTVSHGIFQHRLVGPTTTFNIPCRIRAYVTSYAYYSTGRIGPTFAIGDLADRDAPRFHDEGHSVTFKWDGSTMLHIARIDALNQDYNEILDPSTGIWELLSDTTHNRFHVDDSLFDSADDYSIDGSLHVYVGTASGWSASGGSRGRIEIDWLFVSKFVNPEPSHSSWGSEESNWLSGWGHRKSHVINPASGAGTNYQVRIVVHYGSGTDGDEDAYCDSQCRTDFGDIRFTDDDGQTELDYWIEEKVDSNYGVFWVEISDDLSTTSATIFMYYGNSPATTTSNGPNTFLVFDDFEDGDTTGWSLDDANFTASTDYSYGGSFSGKLEKATGGNGIYFAYQNVSVEDYCICAWAYEDAPGDQWDNYGVGGRYIDSDNYYYGCMINPGPTPDLRIRKRSAGTGSELAIKEWARNRMYSRWSKFDFRVYDTQLRLWINDIEELTATDGGNSAGEPILASWMGDSYDIAYFDNVFVRKYVEPEPQHGIWGSQLPQGGQPDLTIILIAAGIGAFTVIGIAAVLRARSPRPEVTPPEPTRPAPEPVREEEIVPEEITPEREEVESPEPVLPSDILCSYCGYTNPTGAKFCIRCGRHLG